MAATIDMNATQAPSKPRPWWSHLYVQVLAAIAGGVLLGHFWPDVGVKLQPLGKGFIDLVKMIIAPVIFLTVSTGIASVGGGKTLGRLTAKTFAYFLPAAALLGAGFLYTTYLSTGGLVPYYLYSNSDYYRYEGSYWLHPTGIDAANEPKWLYLFHLLLGHHGMLSLTPVFLISLTGMLHGWRRDWLQRMGLFLSLLMIGFYTVWTSNYGGACQGPRWLF